MRRRNGSIETRVLWDGVKSLRFDLTSTERIARTERLRELNDELEAYKEEVSAKKKRVEREKRELLDSAANGYEFRDVPCQDMADELRARPCWRSSSVIGRRASSSPVSRRTVTTSRCVSMVAGSQQGPAHAGRGASAPALGVPYGRPDPAAKARPGAEARRLLGGDEAVHVFASRAEATAYEMRMPGASTISPKRSGWATLRNELRGVGKLIRDRVVIVELERDADEAKKQAVRDIGAALYRMGALEVRCWGRLVAQQGRRAA